jgi:hypothetical protein
MGSFQVPMPERTGRATLLVSVGLLAGLAWVALVVFEEATHSVVHLGGGHSGTSRRGGGADTPSSSSPGGRSYVRGDDAPDEPAGLAAFHALAGGVLTGAGWWRW